MSREKGKGLPVKRAVLSFLNFLFPSFCRICGKGLKGSEYIVCQECRQEALPFAFRHPVLPLEKGRLLSFYRFQGKVKDMIYLFKYQGCMPLGPLLFDQVIDRFEEKPIPYDLLQPVPLTRRKRRRRGYNQSRLLAAYLSGRWKIPTGDLVAKKREPLPQALLGKRERSRNLSGSFALKKGVDSTAWKGKSLLVVDDVFTTGATFEELYKTLEPLGLSRIDILTLAVADAPPATSVINPEEPAFNAENG